MSYTVKHKTVLETIGSTEYVDIDDYRGVPAKIDTGADSSSIWASHIGVSEEGILSFQLFDQSSPFYDGRVLKRKDFKVAVVRSSTGHEQIRYRVHLSLYLSGHKIKALFNLSDRGQNGFPVLIGRRTISGKFLVDVSQKHVMLTPKNSKTKSVQRQMLEDPYGFHRKYMAKHATDSCGNKLEKGV